MPNRSLNIENRYELSKYDSLFVLGAAPLPVLMQPSPQAHYLYLFESSMQQLRKINPKAAGGTLLAQYTCSDMMIYTPPPAAGKKLTRPAPPRPGGARSTTRRATTAEDQSARQRRAQERLDY